MPIPIDSRNGEGASRPSPVGSFAVTLTRPRSSASIGVFSEVVRASDALVIHEIEISHFALRDLDERLHT